MIIIGIDPGKMTGVAVYDTSIPKKHPVTDEIPAAEVGKWLRTQVSFDYPGPDVRVMGEQFTMSSGGVLTPQPEALEVMGVVKDMKAFLGYHLEWVLPSTSKRRAPNELLRKMGWWRPTKDGHGNDACRLIVEGLVRWDQDLYSHFTGI